MTLIWEPRIGDPTFVGWATVVAYFATAGLCVATAKLVAARIPGEHAGRQALIWRMVALLLIALGINKQLDSLPLTDQETERFQHLLSYDLLC